MILKTTLLIISATMAMSQSFPFGPYFAFNGPIRGLFGYHPQLPYRHLPLPPPPLPVHHGHHGHHHYYEYEKDDHKSNDGYKKDYQEEKKKPQYDVTDYKYKYDVEQLDPYDPYAKARYGVQSTPEETHYYIEQAHPGGGRSSVYNSQLHSSK